MSERQFTPASLRLQIQLFQSQRRKIEREFLTADEKSGEYLEGKLSSVNRQIAVAEARLDEYEQKPKKAA